MAAIPLTGNYSYRQLDNKTYGTLYHRFRTQVFNDELVFDPNSRLSAAERQQYQQLVRNLGQPYRLSLGVYHHDAFVGWTSGWQRDGRTYYMVSSGILPAHQRRGIYTALLPVIINTLRRDGFQQVTSRHRMTNNAVLVPKLRFGFMITGFELSAEFGALVHLTYYMDPAVRDVMAFRSGAALTDPVRERLDL